MSLDNAATTPDRRDTGTARREDRFLRVLQRNNVKVMDFGPWTMVLAHGFGCDQNMWRYVSPALEDEFRVVLFHVGCGGSDLKDATTEDSFIHSHSIVPGGLLVTS